VTIFGFATLGVLALYLALFFLASSLAARAAGRPVWLFGRATGRDRLAALGFRVAFALAFVGLRRNAHQRLEVLRHGLIWSRCPS